MSTHPVLGEMLKLGSNNQRMATIAFNVYMDLSEVRLMWDIQYFYNSKLNLIYITAKDHSSQSKPEIFVPSSASVKLSPADVENIQEILCSDSDSKCITLALVETDSTITYYRFSQGLHKPESPESSQKRKILEEKHRVIRNEILRNREQIFNQAQSEFKNASK